MTLSENEIKARKLAFFFNHSTEILSTGGEQQKSGYVTVVLGPRLTPETVLEKMIGDGTLYGDETLGLCVIRDKTYSSSQGISVKLVPLKRRESDIIVESNLLRINPLVLNFDPIEETKKKWEGDISYEIRINRIHEKYPLWRLFPKEEGGVIRGIIQRGEEVHKGCIDTSKVLKPDFLDKVRAFNKAVDEVFTNKQIGEILSERTFKALLGKQVGLDIA